MLKNYINPTLWSYQSRVERGFTLSSEVDDDDSMKYENGGYIW